MIFIDLSDVYVYIYVYVYVYDTCTVHVRCVRMYMPNRSDSKNVDGLTGAQNR